MKKNLYKICGVLLLGAAVLVINACKDEFYTINDSFYDGMQITLKNYLHKGVDGAPDTLRIEQDNVDQIMIEEVSNPELVFVSESFFFETERGQEIVNIDPDGMITPISRGTTRLDITFRANSTLNTSIIVEVYKEYVPVREVQVPAFVAATLVEVDYEFDLSKNLIVLPVNADNKKLWFSIADDAYADRASITPDGIITGVLNSGRNRVTIDVVSDDNPEVTTSFRVQVVNEVLIDGVIVTPGLDGVEIGVGSTLDLNLCTSVTPVTVNPVNSKLIFELLEGTDVLALSDEGVITAIRPGTARLKATSKNNKFVEFTVVVKDDLTDLLRLLWTVETSMPHGTDGTNGEPRLMFDNSAGTYYVVVKPGKSHNGVSTPTGHFPYFEVDMKSVQKFNYIRWNHRSGNNLEYLRVWAIELAGSHDGEIFEDIIMDEDPETKEPILEIPLVYTSTARQDIVIPESEYRYIRVKLVKWSDIADGEKLGNTMQIGEFGVGYR